MIINLFKRKNAKPEFEVIKKAPVGDPISRQKYTVRTDRVFMDSFNWCVYKNGKRIGIDVEMSESAAIKAAEQFILDHEFSGKTVNFNEVTYEVTVNRFEEKI